MSFRPLTFTVMLPERVSPSLAATLYEMLPAAYEAVIHSAEVSTVGSPLVRDADTLTVPPSPAAATLPRSVVPRDRIGPEFRMM